MMNASGSDRRLQGIEVSSSGSSVYRRKATMTASSSTDRTVDLGSLGPVGTMLYRSTDSLCRRGAPMKNLAHSASLDSDDKDAPSKHGIKHLENVRPTRSDHRRAGSAGFSRPDQPICHARKTDREGPVSMAVAAWWSWRHWSLCSPARVSGLEM